jgi:hypothetical protein
MTVTEIKQLTEIMDMSDDSFNRMMDTIAGLLFGIGFGMVLGWSLL